MAPPNRDELVIGWYFPSIVCHSCKNIIPVARGSAEPREIYSPKNAKPILFGCPFCGFSDEYRSEEIKSQELTVLPPTAN